MEEIKKMSDFDKVKKILEIAKKFKQKDNFLGNNEFNLNENETLSINFFPEKLKKFNAFFHFNKNSINISVRNDECKNRFVRETYIQITKKHEMQYILDFFNKNYNQNYFDDLIEEFEKLDTINY